MHRINQIDGHLNRYQTANRALKQFSIIAYVMYQVEGQKQLCVSMDFGFNCLRDVKKVNWQAV
jgi:hypothetical protein